MPSPFAEKAFFQIEGSFRVGKIFLRPFRSSELSRFLDRQKAAQKPPGVRKTRKGHVPPWRRATTRVCKQTVPGACIPVRALSRSRFSQSRNSFYYTFTPLYFYLLCFLLLRGKIPAAFSRCAEKDPAGVPAPGAGGRIGTDLPSPAQRGRRPEPAQGDMRMVLVAPFAIKRCRLKKPVLEGERNRIPNRPPFCAPAYEAGFRKQKKTQKSGLNNYHVTCRVKSSEG